MVPPPITSTTGRRASRFRRLMNFAQLDTATGLPPNVKPCSRDPIERRPTSRLSAEPFSASYRSRWKMLVAKSIRTGCAPVIGKPALPYSHVRLEQEGRAHMFRSDDEQRGHR